MNETLLLYVLFIHFIADFVLQTKWMAENKSKNWKAMFSHIAVYALCMCIFGPVYGIVNATLHLVTDVVSSRLSSRAYAKGNMKGFWMVIGADQLVHQTCLILTLGLI